MKRLILSAVLIVGAAALAQANTVVIQNAENAVFHYVLDPPELTAFDPSASIFPNVVYDYFSEAPAAEDDFVGFAGLDSGQSVRFENLSEGKHLLVGFFVMPGERQFPVRVIHLQAGGELDERTYQIYSEPSFISARAGRGRIAAFLPIPPRMREPLSTDYTRIGRPSQHFLPFPRIIPCPALPGSGTAASSKFCPSANHGTGVPAARP